MSKYQTSRVQVVIQPNNHLGEGLLWRSDPRSLHWVDIIKNTVWSWSADHGTKTISLDTPVTALASNGNDQSRLLILTRHGLESLDFANNARARIGSFGLSGSLRTNDGNPASDGRYWFGSMECDPSGLHGSVYSLGIEGDYKEEFRNVGIPNTFAGAAHLPYLYISDSFQQVTYRLDLRTLKREAFLDFSRESYTPDGGAIDEHGNLWIALWDGFAVKCFSPEGVEIDSIELPVPRPTNCCFGGQDLKTLFVTSASEGLDPKVLHRYPLSGSVFAVELNVAGAKLPVFEGAQQC